MDTVLLSVLLDMGQKMDFLCDRLGYPVDTASNYIVWLGDISHICYRGNLYECLSFLASMPKHVNYQISLEE